MKLKRLTAVVLCILTLTGVFSVTASAAQRTPLGMIDIFEDDVDFYNDNQAVIEAIYQGMMKHESEIYVYNYRISTEYSRLLYDAVKRTHPELFFIGHNYGCNGANNKIYSYTPTYTYTEAETAQMLTEFYNKADWYLDMVNDDMDEFTKAVVLHDALDLNCTYREHNSDGKDCDNYTFLVEGWGVCESYSEVYAYLLAQLGIKSEIVASNAMTHQWMRVRLDGSDYYYNIDITWDDPLISEERDNPCKVYHDFFLLSDEEFREAKENHYGYSYIHDSDEAFDDYDSLHGLSNPLFYVNGELYTIYVSEDDNIGHLATYNHNTDTFTNVLDLNDRWSYYGSTTTAWKGNFSGLAKYDDLLYFNGENCVYVYNPVTGVKRTLLNNVFSDNTQLCGLYISDGKLYGLKAASPRDSFTDVCLGDCLEPHTVTVNNNISNGTVSADSYKVFAGFTVTLTASSNSGFALDRFVVTDASNNAVNVNEGKFEMPDSNVSVSAEFEENIVYFKPSSNWKSDGARFAAYVFNNSTNENSWVSMSETLDRGVYKAAVPAGTWYNIIFCRMNGSTTQNNWNNKWNQTGDLSLTGKLKKCYELSSNVWDGGDNTGWKDYTPRYDYTVVYNYDLNGTAKTITKTVSRSELTDADAIAALNDPSSTISNIAYKYSIGRVEKSGLNINVYMTKTENTFSVRLNGKLVRSDYKYMDKASISSPTGAETGFLIDGNLIKRGKSIEIYVTGDIDVTTDASAVRTDTASINLTASYISDDRVSYELLATANVDNFQRMGVAFSASAKTTAQLTSAIKAVTSGTQVSNKIAVHNSKVDYPNTSGLYQFIYAPYLTNLPSNGATLYFYTYAVTKTGTVVISEVKTVSVPNSIA